MSNINFEQDKREDLDSVNEAGSLAEQVVKLQKLEEELLEKEDELKELKRKSRFNFFRGHTDYDARNEYIYIKIIRRYFS
jgi:hypothetical protein